ncbi:MAG: Xaa-Pro peptidase family protein [Actinomycetota bacterium]|nr:Xaa-Pro peptidase family protein [Actinomycetota bacterium]
MFDYAQRQGRLAERMEAEDVDVLFLAPSADLEYLTGVERQIPSFGEAAYANGWVTGAFFSRAATPVFVFPRMFAAFDLREEPEGELVIVNETDDGFAMFERVAAGLGPTGTIAVGDRVWGKTVLNLGRILGFDRLRTGSTLVNGLRRVKTSEEIEAMGRAIGTVEQAMAATAPLVVPGVTMAELAEAVEHELRVAGSRTTSFTTHIFTGLGDGELDSLTETAHVPMPAGTSVMFDFGGVVDGYCSDFGRTIYCGDPPDDYREIYEVMLAGQEAGRAAAAAGTPASEVNAACRRPIEDAGLGEHFRHRMGHGIGLDIHERPFISEEDQTPLEPGMTFTDEPSIIIPGRFSVRIEDIVVCEEGGGRKLNGYPAALVANT